MGLLSTIERWIIAALLLTCMGLCWSVERNARQAQAARAELAALQAQVAAQNAHAAQTLKTLTEQRDAAQARADAAHALQEQTDAHNRSEIARLAGELERRPVRVRVVTQNATCGTGGGGSAGAGPATADTGATDAAAAHGVLHERNAARLGRLMEEIEMRNAAYASCRARLMQGEM